ncbi:hypothetical protein [Enterococcus sp. AZ180]|uniref:hypothetical protein n=1 Tax=Enterococcus sp. AZ180 TaxID=2774961 RepID=UPI003F216E59
MSESLCKSCGRKIYWNLKIHHEFDDTCDVCYLKGITAPAREEKPYVDSHNSI